MKFEEQLKEWDKYFMRNRQVGHTHSAMNGVLNNDKALLVCAFEKQREMFPKDKTIHFGSQIMGRNNPVVFDNFTIHNIIVKSLTERIEKEKVRKVIDSLKKPVVLNAKLDKKGFVIKGQDSEFIVVKELKKELGLE